MPGTLYHVVLSGPRLKEWFKKRPKQKDKADKELWDNDAEVRASVKKLHNMTDADYMAARM